MWRALEIILLVFLVVVPIRVSAQEDVEPIPDVSILSPVDGQVIRGKFPLIVNTMVEGFVSAELTFTYERSLQETWFLISQSDHSLSERVMAEWDTTLLTDGTYSLRLVVRLKDGTERTHLVKGVRVRNYSPVETDTPTPSPTAAPMATPHPTNTPIPSITPVPPTPTPLPANPLVFTLQDIGINFVRGAAGGFALIVLIGLYISVRNLFSK
jgi:hypothetical protein